MAFQTTNGHATEVNKFGLNVKLEVYKRLNPVIGLNDIHLDEDLLQLLYRKGAGVKQTVSFLLNEFTPNF